MDDWDDFPKVEVHVHLEAGVPLSFYESLPPWVAPAENAFLKVPAQFRPFVLKWFDLVNRLQTPEHLFQLAREFVRHQARQRIVYTEAYCSPLDVSWAREFMTGLPPPLDLQEAIEAYVEGVRAGQDESQGKVAVRLIVDALWTSPLHVKEKLLKILKGFLLKQRQKRPNVGILSKRSSIIQGVGLGGAEFSMPANMLETFRHQCQELKLKLDVHSGEVTDFKTSYDNCQILNPDRVIHACSAFASETLQDRAFSFPIAMCPSSNIKMGLWDPELKPYPAVAAYLDKNQNHFCISVNTDDPLLFQTSLKEEFSLLTRGWATKEANKFFLWAQDNARRSVFDPVSCSKVLHSS